MSARVTIRVNGRSHSVAPGVSVEDALRTAGVAIDETGMALAVNDEVVPRADWASRTISNGDQIELIRAVQGG